MHGMISTRWSIVPWLCRPGGLSSWLDCSLYDGDSHDWKPSLDHHGIWRLGQATIRRQRHLSRASPAPGGESGSLRAEQGCKRILPLQLRWYLQAAVQWAHTSHLTAVSNAHAARSSTRWEQAVMVVSANSASAAHLSQKQTISSAGAVLG